MTHVGYLIAGWGSAFVLIGSYITWVLRRSKKLAQRVPEEHQRWMASDGAATIGES